MRKPEKTRDATGAAARDSKAPLQPLRAHPVRQLGVWPAPLAPSGRPLEGGVGGSRTRRQALASFAAVAALAPAAAAAQVLPDPIDIGAASELFAARYHGPEPDDGKSSIVLVYGGSEGGFASAGVARALARAGHPALAMAYFQGYGHTIYGLPDRLEDVDLESVLRVFDWIGRQPDLKGRPIYLLGESRGAELALLVAARRAHVAGVVAFAPTSVVWAAPAGEGKPAWTEHGRPVPFRDVDRSPGLSSVERFGLALKAPAGPSTISLRDITAPVLLVAGEDDQVWPSVSMGEALVRTAPAGRATLLRYPAAGHLLMGPGPGVSKIAGDGYAVVFGGTEAGNRAARDDAWAKTLAFVNRRRKA